MRKVIFLSLMIILTTVAYNSSFSQTAEEFSARRSRVINLMAPGSILVVETPRTSAMFDNRRTGGDFYYLTGINEPGCTLILFSADLKLPANISPPSREILFIHPVNSARMNWDAPTVGLEGARSVYGFSDVRTDAEAFDFLGMLLTQNISMLYMDIRKSGSAIAPLTEDEQMIRQARDHGAIFEVRSPSSLLLPLLSIKSPAEIEMMQRVTDITSAAQKEAMRSIRPGMFEYQVDAIIRYVFSINGSGSVSFPTIIGSGLNSVVLHWMENSRRMEKGDVVVVDCGAENRMYCADITRTYPVSGKFTNRQKDIYQVVLKANEEAISKVKPGVSLESLNNLADSVLADGMVRLGLIRDKSEFRKYYYHSLSHQIGLKGDPGGPVSILKPGMIITIEPGLYVREEKTGVRIEDDVLVTETGYQVLSGKAPKQVSEIEAGMKGTGNGMDGSLLR
jgi:Xaa-Pro aminopeptidase